jgi:TonB family protein
MSPRALLFAFSLLFPVAALAAPSPQDLVSCRRALEAADREEYAAAVEQQKTCVEKSAGGDAAFAATASASLALFQHDAGQHAEALATLDRTATLYAEPKAWLLAARGREKLELDQVDAARADFEAARALDRNSADAEYGLALVLEREGKREQARPGLLRAFNAGVRTPEMLQRVRDYRFSPLDMPTRKDPPVFPPAALRTCANGTAMVLVTTDALGLPVSVTIEQSSGNADLDRAALAAARKWNIHPDLKDGQYVGGRFEVPLNFANPCEGRKPDELQ